jgi:DNA-binding NtrC family response regulator
MSITGHILIIDDEAALRQTLARILQQAGFEVTTAENGEQGLSFIQTTNFDLVFLDLRMPGMAGMDALKLIHASFPNLPVILFTAQPDLNSAVEALRNGATDYLLKPLKPQARDRLTNRILANRT